MENELCNNPGIIIYQDKVVKTTKVKKWIEKNKPNNYKIIYLENSSTDFKEVERGLKELENKYLGLGPIKQKEVFDGPRPYTHVYKLNVNTTLCAYSQEDLDRLKEWYNVK